MKRKVNPEYIKQLARSFRSAIEKAKQEHDLVGDAVFSRFPCGCCGDTCDLLAHFFNEYNIEAIYICGTNYVDDPFDSQSHAWLLINGELIVDITGDQFKFKKRFYNFNQEVFVGLSDPFYELFEVDPRRDVREYCLTERLKFLYPRIIKHIEL